LKPCDVVVGMLVGAHPLPDPGAEGFERDPPAVELELAENARRMIRPPLDCRTEMSDYEIVKGAEFERRLRRLARRKKVTCEFVAGIGKGSHGRLYFGEEFTTLKDRKKEIGRDLVGRIVPGSEGRSA